jgi:nucleolar MIF4G domain-containing protein 1
VVCAGVDQCIGGSQNRHPTKVFSAQHLLNSTTMSRRPFQQNGLKLPQKLQQELGLNLNSDNSTKRRFRGVGIGRRKESRRAERVEKRSGNTGIGHRLKAPERRVAAVNESEEEEESEDEQEQRTIIRSTASTEHRRPQVLNLKTLEPKPKSILKNPKKVTTSISSTDLSSNERSSSPGLVLDTSSKSFRERAAQDDAEIAALEKKLGLKKKKLLKSFDEDGLGELLEGLDSGDESRKRKREEQDWLKRKRTRVDLQHDFIGEQEGSEIEEEDEGDFGAEVLLGAGSEAFDSEEEGFGGLASATEDKIDQPIVRKRENPYVAPISASAVSTKKYIPPSLRKQTGSEAESLQRLRRLIQGQLNKLSEANLLSILAETEKFYQMNARQDVTSTLIDLLLSLFCGPSVLQNTFIILNASFVAAVYKVIGTDFGADFVSQLIHRFENFYVAHQMSDGKQCVNLISLLAHLYTFHVVGSNLVFDHIRLLLESINETNAEILLRIVRDAGPQLRQDDPSSLKDIVLLMQKSAAKVQAEGVAISIRTKFMMETITDLKNNKLRTELASSGVASEHVTRMRKVVGTLNSRNIRASEPLRIGLADIKNAEKHGKWWLIGASWKEQEKENEIVSARDEHVNGSGKGIDGEEADLLALARQHRMNTAIRRAIFIAIMSAHDYQDGHLRLLKLRLKRSQEQEIPRVLLHCAGAEEKYNPYYTLIAKRLCADKRMKMAFQFSLWDFYKRMGEQADELDDDEGDDGGDLPLKEIVNTARMFGNLIADGTMSLGILKTLNLPMLKEQARTLVEILLIVVICKSQEGARETRDENSLSRIFAKCRETPQMMAGLRHFLRKVVTRTDLTKSKTESGMVKWGCGVAIDTMKVLSAGDGKGAEMIA